MYFIGIDIGTSNCKAGLMDSAGRLLKLALRPTVTHRDEAGLARFDPDHMWENVVSMLQEVTCVLENEGSPAAIGITSMAESGLLVDRQSGAARSEFIPWFDQRTAGEAERIRNEIDVLEQFRKTGLRLSYKYGLPKLLWLQKHQPQALNGSVWLNASDYIAFRLTGAFGTDHTLAARTYAYDLRRMEWNTELLAHFGLSQELLPQVQRQGEAMGSVTAAAAALTGLKAGTPVTIAGHDHVVAALAVGAVQPGDVFNSMGTAETLVGVFGEFDIGEQQYAAGLSFGKHVVAGRSFWMGGTPSSGGSVEWLRSVLDDEKLSYEAILEMLQPLDAEPTGLLYYPYLSGSGAPLPNPKLRGAIIGLAAGDTRAKLVKAVLEGTSYEFESIRRAGEQVAGTSITQIKTIGGGAKNRRWIQIKANVTGCEIQLPQVQEATLLGAAMLAGMNSGHYESVQAAVAAVRQGLEPVEQLVPEQAAHAAYSRLYSDGYLFFQQALRAFATG